MAISFDSLNFKHKMPIQIRFNDVDRYGHVNNNAYFSYYDLGKVDYFNAVMKHDIPKSTDIVPVVVNLRYSRGNLHLAHRQQEFHLGTACREPRHRTGSVPMPNYNGMFLA